MTRLKISNGLSVDLPGLGKITHFPDLSQKRITKCVREMLRNTYGIDKVEVSCTAYFNDSLWKGLCKIHGHPYKFEIIPNDYKENP